PDVGRVSEGRDASPFPLSIFISSRASGRLVSRAPRGDTLKYGPMCGRRHHDPNRHEAQSETARGGLPSVLRAIALRVLRLGRSAGHGVTAAFGAVDSAVGVRLALPRSMAIQETEVN